MAISSCPLIYSGVNVRLDSHYIVQWIGRGGPRYSPNRATSDFLLGDCLKQRTLDEMKDKLDLLLSLSTFSEKFLSLCLPDWSGVCKMIGPMLKFDTKY